MFGAQPPGTRRISSTRNETDRRDIRSGIRCSTNRPGNVIR